MTFRLAIGSGSSTTVSDVVDNLLIQHQHRLEKTNSHAAAADGPRPARMRESLYEAFAAQEQHLQRLQSVASVAAGKWRVLSTCERPVACVWHTSCIVHIVIELSCACDVGELQLPRAGVLSLRVFCHACHVYEGLRESMHVIDVLGDGTVCVRGCVTH